MSPYILLALPIPALVGSLLLLNSALAPTALLHRQAVVSVTAGVSAFLYLRHAFPNASVKAAPWLLLGTAALVWAPLLESASSPPHRWLGLAGLRVYIAPVVLPVFLLLWHRALFGTKVMAASSIAAAALVGLGLLAQPDAAQLTAFAVASAPVSVFSKTLRVPGLLTFITLLAAAAVAWCKPDPLVPVSYVEGVFSLAANASSWALLAAVLSVALPTAFLGWLAVRTGSRGLLAVMLYFGTLYVLAPLQVSPVPLLGFGAAPIIGYFLMASQAGRGHACAALR